MAGEAISKAFHQTPCQDSNPPVMKKKRNLPGTPDPEAEVIALSPKTLMATNRFLCEICGKGFQRDQNLQLHRRGHNLPWKLRQRSGKEPRKRVYVCPEKSCVHNHPTRALGDLTGIKKHFCRKHGEKKWKCEKCSKRYAVQSDWKAHSKTCGTREYRCDCGTLFSRRDSFVTHRAFCDALAEETARVSAAADINSLAALGGAGYHLTESLIRSNMLQHFSSAFKPAAAGGEAADPGLSLWTGHGPQISAGLAHNHGLLEMHQLGPMTMSAGTLYGDPFAALSSAQQLDCQLSWMYGNKLSSPSSGELTSTLLPTGGAKEVDGPQPLVGSVPSLYSTQHRHRPVPPVSDMSATALLQRAALMGVTSSGPSFLESFEMKCRSNKIGDGNKHDAGLLNPNLGRSNLELIGDDLMASKPYEMYSSRHCVVGCGEKDDMGGGETRDFLGVGVQTLCPSSFNGWI